MSLENEHLHKMVEWIESPFEFNRPPDRIAILDQRELYWPSHTVETCSLVEFYVDEEKYIGFTGPITWCFIDIDWDSLSYEKLYELYCGWYIEWATKRSETYPKQLEGNNKAKVGQIVINSGYENVVIENVLYIGKDNYYEISATKNGNPVIIAGIENDLAEFDANYILPFYDAIGTHWTPLDIDEI